MSWIVGAAVVLAVFVGPLLVGGFGYIRGRGASATVAPRPWDWRLTAASALIYAIAFNLTFFIQELFLVVPKALTPGLRPTLYHNNHGWTGDHPLASLFQGTGALAIFIVGLACALLVRGGAGRTTNARLFLIWMAYNGLFQSLPQVVVGAVNPANDVGMAMDYLQLGAAAKAIAALLALAAIPPVALWLARRFIALAGEPAASARERSRVLLRAATLPALIAIPLIILFRVPREAIEVLLPPVLIAWIGIAWMQAWAWRIAAADPAPRPSASLAAPALALLALVLFFQLVLRPGIAFY